MNIPKIGLVRLLLCCSALVLASCGGGAGDFNQAKAPEAGTPPIQASQPGPSSTAAAIDACSLLTKAEVEAAVGKPVPEPTKSIDANVTNCNYGNPPILWVSVTTGTSDTQAKTDHDFNKTVAAAALEPVSGVGDDAFWNGRVQGLWVLKGKHQFSILKAADSNAAKALALKAQSRLP